MITVTENKNYYSYYELSEYAQNKAYEDWWETSANDFFWFDEVSEVLNNFKNTFEYYIGKFDWRYDTCNFYTHLTTKNIPGEDAISYSYCDELEEITGVRLATWLYNNFGYYIYDYKTYYGKNSKKRTSRVQKELSCPTGYYLGYTVTYVLDNFIKNPISSWTLEDVLKDVLHELIKEAQQDYENSLSREYFEEAYAQVDNYMYYEDGRCTYMTEEELTNN